MNDAGIIIPALNEEASIGAVLDELLMAGFRRKNILVVDNGSKDETLKIALKKEVGVIVCPEKGKGNAVRRGMAVLSNNPEIDKIFTIDADYTYPADAVKAGYVWLCKAPHAVFVMERKSINGAMPLLNRVANIIINKWTDIVNPMFVPVRDVCSGLWCFPRSVIEEMLPKLRSEGFTIESEYYCRLADMGRVVYGYPYIYRKRLGGEKKTKPMDVYKIMKFVWDNRCE